MDQLIVWLIFFCFANPMNARMSKGIENIAYDINKKVPTENRIPAMQAPHGAFKNTPRHAKIARHS